MDEEDVFLCQARQKSIDEEKCMQELSKNLKDGRGIDFFFNQYQFNTKCLGTALHCSIIGEHVPIVEYTLSRGASIAVEMISKHQQLRYRSALDLAAYKLNLSIFDTDCARSIAKILMKRSLELYSSFGLTSFHLYCAFTYDMHTDHEGIQRHIANNAAHVNAVISIESPVWAGMTPLLIAAKFEKKNIVKFLLNLGAGPFAQDPEGNTALHYLHGLGFFEERLFALDPKNTFGSFTGSSHFHLACEYCRWHPDSLRIVKRYLDQGVSPDLPTQNLGFESDQPSEQVGLHIAAEEACSNLVQLLLEYGADIDKQNSRGNSPVEYFFKKWSSNKYAIFNDCNLTKCMCSFIEGGANMKKIDMYTLLKHIVYVTSPKKQIFLGCIRKLLTLDEHLVSEELMDLYVEVREECDDWDEAEYTEHCLNELTTLSHLDLREIMDGTTVVRSNFKDKFAWYDSFDSEAYPIYGCLLKIKTKRRLLEFEDKRRKISQVVPLIQELFQSFCYLPDLCAESILWNLNDKELDQFTGQFTNEV